jgi:hypothetical protein
MTDKLLHLPILYLLPLFMIGPSIELQGFYFHSHCVDDSAMQAWEVHERRYKGAQFRNMTGGHLCVTSTLIAVDEVNSPIVE